MRVIILGAYGQIGTALRHAFAFEEVHPYGRELDLLQPERVSAVIREIRPHYVLNTAGYTYAAGVEKNSSMAFQVNAHAMTYLVSVCEEVGATLVQFSPESVFSGNCVDGYYETNEPDPQMSSNTYGRTKAEAERLIRHIAKKPHYIIRSSWVYGQHGHNLVNRFISQLTMGTEIVAPNKVFACPTSANDLADAVHLLLSMRCQPGTYHLVNEGMTTPFGLAVIIADIIKSTTRIKLGVTELLYQDANPPMSGILVPEKIKGMRPFREALRDYLIGIGDLDLRK